MNSNYVKPHERSLYKLHASPLRQEGYDWLASGPCRTRASSPRKRRVGPSGCHRNRSNHRHLQIRQRIRLAARSPLSPGLPEARAQMDRDGCDDSPIIVLQIIHSSKRVAAHTLPVLFSVLKCADLFNVEFKSGTQAVSEDTTHFCFDILRGLEEYSFRKPARSSSA
jgi:hypothetical protein